MLDGSSIHSCRRTAAANIVEIRIGETGVGATASAGSPINKPATNEGRGECSRQYAEQIKETGNLGLKTRRCFCNPVGHPSSMVRRRRLRAHALVRHVAGTPFYAVVGGNHAGRAKSFVVLRRNVDGRAQLFIEAAKVGELLRLRREFAAVVGEQKLLIAGVPEARELPGEEDRRRNGHLVGAARDAAEFHGAAVLVYSGDSPGASPRRSPARGGQVHP